MTGANYMGGRRNAARARTRDAAGRAQKRHFVQQRLVNALANNKASKDRDSGDPRLPSTLPCISLAHAHHTRAHTESPQVSLARIRTDPFHSSSSDTGHRHKQPSKVLAALDTSDHMSIRAAIDRILNIPDLVGIHAKAPSLDDLGYEDMAEICHGYDADSQNNPERSTTSITGDIFDSSNIETGPTNNIFAYDPPKETPVLMKNCPSSPLPQSSPWTSDSPITEGDAILEFETSPTAPPSPIAEWSDDQSMSFPHYMRSTKQTGPGTVSRKYERPNLSHRAFHSPTWENSSYSSSMISLNPFPLKPASPNLRNSDRFTSHNMQPNSPDSPVFPTEDGAKITVPSDLPLNFLTDPDPWATIGRTLKLEPLPGPSPRDEPLVDYTKGREGVGYTQDERCLSDLPSASPVSLQKSSNVVSVEHSVQDGILPSRVTLITSSPCPDLHGVVYDDVKVSRCILNCPVRNSDLFSPSRSRPSSHAGLNCVADGGGEYGWGTGAVGVFRPDPVHGQLESAHRVPETCLREVDVEMCFDGPCLFRDSDFEDE